MIDSKEISVIVQGAVDSCYTLQCLNSIRKYLPGAEIILSTWEGSDVSNLKPDKLLLNKDPGGILCNPLTGVFNNCNRQLISTRKALLNVKRKYCLKLRSDLIIKNTSFLKYWDKFCVRNEKYSLFNHRVICSSIYSREYSNVTGFYLPFHPSDFWFFGLSEDIKNYFLDCPLQTEAEGALWCHKYPSRIPYPLYLWRYSPEQWFCVNWVKKYYPDLQFDDFSDWSYENIKLSNNILYNNFIILGAKQSGIISLKHIDAENCNTNIHHVITYDIYLEKYKQYCDLNYNIVREKSKNTTNVFKCCLRFLSW